MSRDETQRLLAELETALERHGARPERWPEAPRARLAGFIATDAAAARLVAEARALDNVLAFAPRAQRTRGLEERILAAAASLPQQAAGETVVPFPSRQDGRAPQTPMRGPGRRIWPELTLLAASLFLGLLIGISGQAVPALHDIAAIAEEEGMLGTIAALLLEPGEAPEQGAL